MNPLKYKLFQYGIYGTSITNFSYDELVALIFDFEVEILDSDIHKNLIYQSAMVSFINYKNELLEKFKINKNNVTEEKILMYLNDCYIKMNIDAWFCRLEVLKNYQTIIYLSFFDVLVKNDDFAKMKDYVDIKKIRKKKTLAFFESLVANEYMETKKEKKQTYCKLLRHDGVIKIYSENNSDSQYAKLRLINSAIENNASGITTPQIAELLGTNSKIALRETNKLVVLNSNILPLIEVEGKLKRYRYFTKDNYETFKSQSNNNDANNSIFRSEKLEALSNMLIGKIPTVINKRLCEQYAELLKSKYVPDTKNMKKLCLEAGFLIKTIRQDTEIANNVTIVYNDSVELNEKDFINYRRKPKTIAPKRENDSFFNCFVSEKSFVARDNGYIPSQKMQTNILENAILNMLLNEEEVVIDSNFIDNLTLAEFFIYNYYPMFIYLKINEDETFLHETIEYGKPNFGKVCLKTKICELKKYENFEFTQLFKIMNQNNIQKLATKIDKNQFIIKANADSVVIKLNNNIPKLNSERTDDSVLFELANSSNEFLPYIEVNKRIDFYYKTKSTGLQNNLIKLQRYIDCNYGICEYDALMFCLGKYAKTKHAEKYELIKDMQSSYFNDMCKLVKQKIVEHECLKYEFFETDDKYTIVKILDALKKSSLIVADSKTIFYNEVYKKIFNPQPYNSLIPYKIYLNGIEDFKEDNYRNKVLKYITNTLIMEGTYELTKMAQKLKFLSFEEILEVVMSYSEFLKIIEISGEVFLTIGCD